MSKDISLFDEEYLDSLVVGSIAWKKAKYKSLIQLTFDILCKMSDEIYDRYHVKNQWASDDDYYTEGVITDIFHYYYFDEFVKHYPNAIVYKQKPYYLY